jgi:hypothetical protein
LEQAFDGSIHLIGTTPRNVSCAKSKKDGPQMSLNIDVLGYGMDHGMMEG